MSKSCPRCDGNNFRTLKVAPVVRGQEHYRCDDCGLHWMDRACDDSGRVNLPPVRRRHTLTGKW